MKKRVTRTLCSALMVLFCIFGYSDIPKPLSPPRMVNDYIGFLEPGFREKLERQLVAFNDSTSIQIAVIIVGEFDGDIGSFATETGEKWGVGPAGRHTGVVFMIAPNQHKCTIRTGYGVEEYLSSIICDRIIKRLIIPAFKDDNYQGGIQAGVDEIIETLGPMTLTEHAAFEAEQVRQRKRQSQEFLDTCTWVIFFGLIAGTFIFVIFRTIRKSKRVKEKVIILKKYYANILADEIVPDDMWPNWAHEEFGKSAGSYITWKHVCGKEIAGLPHWFLTRLFVNEKKFPLTQKDLKSFDQVDRVVTKIRDDVKLYNERAEGSIVQTKEKFNVVTTLINKSSADHNFGSEKTALGLIKEEMERLVVTDADSKRTCFLLAFTLTERLAAIKKSVDTEIAAKVKFVADVKVIRDRLPSLETAKKLYEQHLDKLSKFPVTVLTELDTLAVLAGRVSQVGELLDNVVAKSEKALPGKYADCLVRIGTISAVIAQVETMVKSAGDRLQDLALSEKLYKARHAEVEKVVVEAEKAVKDPDVKTETIKSSQTARASLATAVRLAGGSKVDWILVHTHFDTAEEQAKSALAQAKLDNSNAESARSSNNESKQTDTSPFFTTTTISTDTGGGFGGFGGGSFSGGGATGSW